MTSEQRPLTFCLLYPTVRRLSFPAAPPTLIPFIGSADALKSLLQANAHQAFLYAISKFRPNESTTLRAAFSRALRAISVAIADTVGPSQWGLGLREHPEEVRNEARMALDFLFEVRSEILTCSDIPELIAIRFKHSIYFSLFSRTLLLRSTRQ